MRVLFLFFLLIAFCIAASGQQVTSEISSTKSASTKSAGSGQPNGGKVEVPIKKRPTDKHPKDQFANHDRRKANEDAWKTAAVFKDFYQTGPGYNTEPSNPPKST